MDNGVQQKPEDSRLFPAQEPPLIIEPLKPPRPSRTVREIEALVVGLQVALVTELNATKEEILDAIREGQASVEAMAREMERKVDGEADPQDDSVLP